ncbi:hypothetical protein Dimus_011773 [Dionaea muscipula]
MAPKLINLPAHEAQNPFERSLKEAYDTQVAKLRPPLKLIVLPPSEYVNLNRAILYGALCEPHVAKTYLKYLHAIVTDGYSIFCKLLIQLVDELYSKLLEIPKVQLNWIASTMVDVAAISFGGLLVSLLRQIVGGDFSEGNLWLSFELVNLFLSKWDLILDEEPMVLTSALYTYLRLLADHYRIPSSRKSDELRRREIEFCNRVLREQFTLCLKMGRDLIRLLQDLVHIIDFQGIWKDLMLNPGSFKTPEFSDISFFYRRRTSSRYFLLRITPEMELQLRFLLSQVKLGNQRRHQAWFARKFLFSPERETLVCDIVRFICCAHHPPNEVLQSGVIPRWAVIGWLLKCCRKSYIEANAKLALFYDWLFFDDVVDNIMNIEPAILLMVNSIPRYMDITHNLLEFLVLLVDNYDVERQNIILKGVSSAFSILISRGVICSLDVLTSCDTLSPILKERVQKLLFTNETRISKELQPPQPVTDSLPSVTSVDLQTSMIPRNAGVANRALDVSSPTASCSTFTVNSGSGADTFENIVYKLGENMTKSKDMGLKLLEKILMLYISLEDGEVNAFSPDALACNLETELEVNGYTLFAPLQCPTSRFDADEGFESATATIIRIFIFSQNARILDMLLYWLRNSRPVGSQLLSYALRLACEAQMAGDEANCQVLDACFPLLRIYVNAYFAFISSAGEAITENAPSASIVDKKLIFKLVQRAFSSYECMITKSTDVSSKESVMSLGKQLSTDLISCPEWEKKRHSILLHAIFSHLHDLVSGDEHVMRLIVSQLDETDLVALQIDLALRRFSIFGDSVQTVLRLVRRSSHWDLIDQDKLWGLIRSEIPVSNFAVEKLLLDVFCSADLDPSGSSLSVGGILSLCKCCAPTPGLVGAVMLLPKNNFPDFSAAVLANWVVSNSSMLFSSIAEFLDKLQKQNGDIPLDWIRMINQSAVMYLLNYLGAMDGGGISMLGKLSANLSAIKSKFGNSAFAMDVG